MREMCSLGVVSSSPHNLIKNVQGMNMNRPTTTVFKQKAFFDERVRATGMQSIFHAESVKLYLRKNYLVLE